MSLKSRVHRLEKRLRPKTKVEPPDLEVVFCDRNAEIAPDPATIGDKTFRREPGESVEKFKARVRLFAHKNGGRLPNLIIWGLQKEEPG